MWAGKLIHKIKNVWLKNLQISLKEIKITKI